MHVGIPDWWDDGLTYLGQDPIMGKLIGKYGPDGLKGKGDLFNTLIRSIVGQQISV
ncbi:MAG: DNA-3-methyladenine glycosylase 2 family protein, partial [Euryarchaeota archaeon]|nr:DNA-3-methyladenine glycosylase 2 family protein [Euryarchaeota archaeon]